MPTSTRPEISICTTCYNNKNRIRESLDSIISCPHFDDRMELVIAENYSTDGTWDIIQEYARKHKNIVAFRAKCTIGEGRALAFTRSKGKFVTSTDMDMVYDPVHWKMVWKYAEICKKDDIWLLGTFMFRETMERIGNWSSMASAEDMELFVRASTKYKMNLCVAPITTGENEVVRGRRGMRYEKSLLKKLRYGLKHATAVISSNGLKFSDIKSGRPMDEISLKILYIWMKLTGKKIYRYGNAPNPEIMWNNITLVDP